MCSVKTFLSRLASTILSVALFAYSTPVMSQDTMTGIRISPSEKVVRINDGSTTFTVTAVPEGAKVGDIKEATVTLTNPDVGNVSIRSTFARSISRNGEGSFNVNILGYGTTGVDVTIIMDDDANTTFNATASLTVEARKVTGISLDKQWIDVNDWDWLELKGTITPLEPDNVNIIISQSNPIINLRQNIIKAYTERYDGEDHSCFNVFEDGKADFISYGVTELTVTTDDGGYTASCIINHYTENQVDGYHNVRFLDLRGNVLLRETIKDGDAAVLPPSGAPVEEGREFIGWSEDFSHINTDLDIYAQYTLPQDMMDKTFALLPEASLFYDTDGNGLKETIGNDLRTFLGDYSKNFGKTSDLIINDVETFYLTDDINADGKPDYSGRFNISFSGSKYYQSVVSDNNEYKRFDNVYIVPGLDLNSDGRRDHLRYDKGWYVCYAQPDGTYLEEFMQTMTAAEYESAFDPDAWASTAVRRSTGLVTPNYGYVTGLSAVSLAKAPMRSSARAAGPARASIRYAEVPAPSHAIDLNADGMTDLVDEYSGIVYFNMGGGKWIEQSIGGSVLSADLNADGYMDFVLPGDQLVTMIYRKGGEFSTQTLYENIQVDQDMYCHDFDADGDVDILVTFSAPYNSTGFAYTMFFRNDGNGNFSQLDEQDYGDDQLVFRACQDVDGDGIMDLLALRGQLGSKDGKEDAVLGDSIDVVLLKGTGKLSFYSPSRLFAVRSGYESEYTNKSVSEFRVNAEDIDNDGLMEIWVSGIYNVYKEVYYESWDINHEYPHSNSYDYTYIHKMEGTPNAAPEAPARPSVIYDGGKLTITWADGSDSRTSRQDLTYALRIGTTSGGMEILKPHSNADGSRRNFLDGEMGKLHSYSIDLGSYMPGRIYVAVQAIDAQHQGSQWSQEAVVEHSMLPVSLSLSRTAINFNDTLTVGFTPLPDSYTRSWKCDDGTVVSQTASTARICFSKPGTKQVTMTVTAPDNRMEQYTAAVKVSDTGLADDLKLDYLRNSVYAIRRDYYGNYNGMLGDYTFDGWLDGVNDNTFYRGGEGLTVNKSSGLWATGLDIKEGKWYDYDHDGCMDFVFYNGSLNSNQDGTTYITDGDSYYLPHNGTGNLKSKVQDDGVRSLFYTGYTNGVPIMMLDYNHNGHYDYLVYDYSQDYPYTVYLYSRQSDGTYAASDNVSGMDYTSVSSEVNSQVVDVNRDGFMDIVTLDWERNHPYKRVLAYLNQGDGRFERMEIPFEQEIAEKDMGDVNYVGSNPNNPPQCSFADFNNDGFTDIFAWRDMDGAPYIMYNVRNSYFSAPQLLSWGELESYQYNTGGSWNKNTWSWGYELADVNNDGYMDIVSMQLNAKAGTDKRGIYVHYLGPDGVKDQGFIIPEMFTNLGAYGQDGFELLQMPGQLMILNHWKHSGYVSDNGNEVGSYYECLPVIGPDNNRPQAPAGVRAVQTQEGLLIEWNDAVDDHTPGAQMRYNVSVKHAGQSGAGAFVISPQNGLNADAAYLPGYVYVKANRYLVPISALSAGDYEIQIQALDLWNSMSEFSEPVTVSIDRYVIDAPTLVSLGDDALITYMGDASAATPAWNFDGGTVVSGSGYGPYRVRWSDGGTKTITLTMNGKTYERMLVVDVNDATVGLPEYLFEGTSSQVDIPDGITVQWDVYIDGKYKRLTAGGINGTDRRLSVSDGKLFAAQSKESLGKVTLKLTLINANGTAKVVEQPVSILSADNMPAITLVTSDAQGHYVIGFQASDYYFEGVRIYKESKVSGQFIELGTVDPLSGSYTDPTSNSSIKAERYRIAGVMSNGTLSPYSKVHQTVHMNINRGIQDNTYNLIWNAYKGADVVSYNILRGQSDSDLAQIASVSASNLSYTDVSPDASKPYYAIEYVLADDAAQAPRRAPGSITGRSNAVSTQAVRNVTYVTGLSILSASGSYSTTATNPSVYLYAEFSPVSATYKTVRWEIVSGTELATISEEGLLTAMVPNRGGTVTVRATALDGSGVSATRQISIGSISCFTVTFTDWDGTVIDVQTVESGQGARLPDAPFRAGYKFTGWDKDVSAVTGNITVKALYESQTAVEDVKAGNRSWDTYKVLDSEGKLYIVTPSGIYNTHGLRQK